MICIKKKKARKKILGSHTKPMESNTGERPQEPGLNKPYMWLQSKLSSEVTNHI